MQKIIFFFNRLFLSGVKKASFEDDKQKIIYLNQGMILGVLLFIPNLIFEAYIGFLPATILNLIFIFLAIFCFFILRQGKYNIAKNLTFIGLDVILLIANITEGTRTGNYLIYSALILLFPILMKLNDKKIEIGLIFCFTLFCLICSITLCPFVGHFKGLSNEDANLMFKGNFAVTFVLTCVLAYIIFLITQAKEFELIKAKKIAEKNAQIKLQFISNMSHELRTPLNGIIGTTNLLQLEEHTALQKEQFDLLDYSSKHMLHLVNDVLDFSKIESGKIELEKRCFNLQNFVQNIYHSFDNQFEKQLLYFKLENNDRSFNYNIIGDDMRLIQVLNNLLSNALKFTHKGGVTFNIHTTLLNEDKLKVKFEIMDTGIGIKSESFHQIFESFVQADLNTTRQYGGTGLGLTISKKLVEVFGSELKIESKVGEGSKFYFTVIFDRIENIIENNIEKELKLLTGLRILIAEDNKINMLIAKKFLLKWGVLLTEAKDGKEAIELFTKDKFDVILLDLEMPIIDGFTALQEIKKIEPTIPAIAFTAAVFENMHISLTEKGFTDFISKPFIPEELNSKLYQQKILLVK